MSNLLESSENNFPTHSGHSHILFVNIWLDSLKMTGPASQSPHGSFLDINVFQQRNLLIERDIC